MIIGITGSFGSGKTIVANMFKKYGYKVINVDKLYHDIYNRDKSLRNKIKKEFGTIKRNELKKIVFKNSNKLKKLNKITHPVIIKEIKKQINKISKTNAEKPLNYNKKNKNIEKKGIVIDIPLLFEAKLERMFDKIIVVKCSKKEQINRVLKKKKYTKKEIDDIINFQMSLKEKIKKADFVVNNDISKKVTSVQVEILAHILQT